MAKRHWRRWCLIGLATFMLAWIGVGYWHASKPLPPGFAQTFPWRLAEDPQWLYDLSWQGEDGQQQYQQEIFDQKLALIAQAQRLIVVDMFLFNAFGGAIAGGPEHRPLSQQLTDALLAARARRPSMPIVLISDPINTVYGGMSSSHFEQLRQAGITVVLTPLAELPDSNPAWSGVWRLCCRWLDNREDVGWLPNPFDASAADITLRSYLQLLNFKANHRKTLLVDQGPGWRAVVSSANPHDGSSRHSNTALAFSGDAAIDLWQSERAILALAGMEMDGPDQAPTAPDSLPPNSLRLRVLTEQAIRDAALAMIDESQAGEELMLASFYLSHRPLLESLLQARQRGVTVRVLLDANRDAFGREKNGVPNRPVGAELDEAGITVRWCATSGEQCHSKWLMRRGAKQSSVISGSANFTRRNIDGFNLETSIQMAGPRQHPQLQEAAQWFDRRWSNQGGRFSLPFEALEASASWHYGQYRFMEASGLSTF
jgi:phosphatidylserine/phosphatidylglycerophosphate/cardiolipin synthase-like enzyme